MCFVGSYRTAALPYIALPLGLALTTVATLLYMRSKLSLVWDVQLKIRPPQYFDPQRDLSVCEQAAEWIKDQVS